ncbi:hypothetical protein AURDEDRAFT_115466 [Auricularia subglabra TFB-10046 SS5]|uniref:Uncharacterized protein n=1 Tax=Auricularia subglabra (strain TFB-10046 / SS5) TaxID=717982 RepID=J0WYN8_AURST|nr:hypothetical protein AURDEDRAFT_115466 [Auricularia subglabra TFB-10046 SS5]
MSAITTPTPQDIRIEDDDYSQFMYRGLWRTIPSSNEWQFSGGSQHLSYAKGAEFSVSFNGSYVWFLSDTNYDHGRFQVSVDDHVFGTLTGSSETHENNILLFSAPLDPSKQHTLVVTNIDEGKAITLDCIIYRPVEPSSSTTSPPASQQTSTGSTPTPSSRSRTPAGVYIGIALGTTAFILLAILVGFILVERRRRRRQQPQPPCYLDATTQPLSWSAFPQPSRTPSPRPQQVVSS